MKGTALGMLARHRLPISLAGAGLLTAAAWYAVREGTIFNFHEYCPLSPVCVLFTTPANGILWPWGAFFFGTLLISALFLRRLFCGWFCPVGLAQDLLYLPRRLMKKSPARPATAGQRIASLASRSIVLAATIFAPFLTGAMLFAQFCPMIRIGDVLYRSDLAGGILTLGTLVVGSLLIERFFCRFVCPLGLLLGWSGRIGAKVFPTLTVHKTCKAGDKCGKCGGACPMKIDLCAADGALDDAECILCLTCVTQCRCYSINTQK